MKNIVSILCFCFAFELTAQLTPGSSASDFSATDISGIQHQLYAQLDSGKTVILHCFAASDSYAWEYYQQQTLEAFQALYGASGTDDVAIWRVECLSENSIAQLQGPTSMTGNAATDTQGDWLSASSLPVIDDSVLTAEFALPYLPLLVVICPDRLVRFADLLSLGNLANLVFQTACPTAVSGFDPALVSASTSRVCGSSSVDVNVVLKNLGTDTLFAVTIGLDGAALAQDIQWQGQLNPYQSDTLEIEGLEVLSDAFINCYISGENVNVNNDSLRLRADVGFSTQLVRLELAMDAYPDETSWEIRNDQDSVIYNGGGYEVDYQYINNVFMLPSTGCYSFYLNDTQGDGLFGSQYGGFDGFCKLYSMTDSATVEEELFFYDGSYNFSTINNTPGFLQYTFEAGSPLVVTNETMSGWRVFPIPADDQLRIHTPHNAKAYRCTLFDLAGRVVLQTEIPQGDIDTELQVVSLPAGIYSLAIEMEHQYLRIPLMIQHP